MALVGPVCEAMPPYEQTSFTAPEAGLSFPPFSPPPPSVFLRTFQDFREHGVYLSANIGQSRTGRDQRGISLMNIDVAGTSRSSLKGHDQTSAKTDKTIRKEDAWKIGDEGGRWVEPSNSMRADVHERQSPFERVIVGTREFMVSRREAFAFTRTRRLFDLVRNAFGLRTSFRGTHWPALILSQNDDHSPYAGINALSAKFGSESCVLLSDPVTSVRGFLALARREAEAGWDFEPALQLSKITSAFLAYLLHHNIFPEQVIRKEVEAAASLASLAPRMLTEAKVIEDIVCSGTGWNRASWTAWGGVYGGPERGGLEREDHAWGDIPPHTDEADDGGWTVEPVLDTRPDPLHAEQVLPLLSPLVSPLKLTDITMLHYIPFARRKVIRVLPPQDPCPMNVAFASEMYQITTVAAPWTPEERWRAAPRFEDETAGDEDETAGDEDETAGDEDETAGDEDETAGDEDETAGDEDKTAGDDPTVNEEAVFEKEINTMPEPEEIVIWLERNAVERAGLADSLIGLGLRGRWAMMGTEEISWWTFKAKDYILPTFWQSAELDKMI